MPVAPWHTLHGCDFALPDLASAALASLSGVIVPKHSDDANKNAQCEVLLMTSLQRNGHHTRTSRMSMRGHPQAESRAALRWTRPRATSRSTVRDSVNRAGVVVG